MRPLLRPQLLVAVLLVVGGLYVVIRGITYTTESQIMRVGDFEATVEERHSIPTWVGVVAIVGGLVLIAASRRPSSTAGAGP